MLTHATLSATVQPLALPPRVLFGTRTSQQEALSCPTVSLRSQAAQQGCAVLHATLEAADACSPLRVARTIFFSQGAAAAETPLQLRLKPPPAQQQQQGDVDGSECRAAGQPAAAAAAAAVIATGVSNSGADRPGSSNADDGMCRCDSGSANNSAGTGCGPKQQQQAQQPSCQQQQEQQQQQQLPALPVGQALSNGDFDPDQTDLFDLMCWYWAAVDAAWQGMEYYSTKVGVVLLDSVGMGVVDAGTACGSVESGCVSTHVTYFHARVHLDGITLQLEVC